MATAHMHGHNISFTFPQPQQMEYTGRKMQRTEQGGRQYKEGAMETALQSRIPPAGKRFLSQERETEKQSRQACSSHLQKVKFGSVKLKKNLKQKSSRRKWKQKSRAKLGDRVQTNFQNLTKLDFSRVCILQALPSWRGPLVLLNFWLFVSASVPHAMVTSSAKPLL